MADLPLRELERAWKITDDPVIGLRLILARFRAGIPVDLDSFPLVLWHQISAQFSMENISHHLSLGGARLDQQIASWLDFVNNLHLLGNAHYCHPLIGNTFAHANLRLIASAALHQQCKTAIVYYPTLPEDKRIAVYITMVLSPQTLSAAEMQELQEGIYADTFYWGLVLKAFFNPQNPRLVYIPRILFEGEVKLVPQQLAMATLLDASPHETDPLSWVTQILNNVPAIYDMPVEPPSDNLGYRVPFLVLKELA